MERNAPYQNVEASINLKDLFFFVLKKWRVWLIMLIVGGIIGGGIVYWNFLHPATEVSLNRIEKYELDKQILESHLVYINESVLQGLNPYAVYSSQLTYNISAPAASIGIVAAKYESLFNQPEMYTDMLKASGLNCSEWALKELLTVELSSLDSVNIYILSLDQPCYGKLTVTINAPSEEACNGIISVIQTYIDKQDKALQKEYENSSVLLLNDTITFGYSEAVEKKQEECVKAKAGLRANIQASKQELTAADLEYTENIKMELSRRSLLKNTLLYGMFAFLLAFIVLSAIYIADTHVKTEAELKKVFRLPAIATLPTKKTLSKRGPDAWIRKLADKSAPPFNTPEYLRNAILAMTFSKALLCGNGKDADVNVLKDSLVESDERLLTSEPLAVDETAQLRLKDADGAILFVKLWNTTSRELQRELEICRSLGKPVLGAIVLK